MKWMPINYKENITNNEIVDKILSFNNIKSLNDYQKLTKLSFPFSFKNTEYFIDTINKHKDGKIIIIGDYDCDGVCATSIMIKFLNHLNISCDYIIGDRFIDGYGINNSLVDKVKENNGTLLITVDNGIKGRDAISYAKSLGIECMVTDHHIPEDDNIPDCEIFNPHYNEVLPFSDFCGAFVAFCLAFNYNKSNKSIKVMSKEQIMELYELASLATIGDVMPLYDINRKIVSLLVERMKNNTLTNKGLSLLRNRIFDNNNITASDIAYRIVPIINAPGRLDNARIVVDLLLGLEDNLDICIQLNEKRKEITKETLSNITLDDGQINVIYIPNINEGIIGIIAGSIKEKTNKPTFVFTNGEADTIKGSGRSIEGFNILENTLNVIQGLDLTAAYGGHQGAMGITLKNIEAFKTFKKVMNECTIDICEPTKYYINISNFSIEQISNIIDSLEPIGQGLSIPSFKIIGEPFNIKIIKGLHSQFTIRTNSGFQNFMAFNKIIDNSNREFYFDINKSYFNGRIYYKGFITEAK